MRLTKTIGRIGNLVTAHHCYDPTAFSNFDSLFRQFTVTAQVQNFAC